jgi:hypothetical protein
MENGMEIPKTRTTSIILPSDLMLGFYPKEKKPKYQRGTDTAILNNTVFTIA